MKSIALAVSLIALFVPEAFCSGTAPAQPQTAFASLSAADSGGPITVPAPSKPAELRTAAGPLKSPAVTAYISDQINQDGSACRMWNAKLYSTADPATRDQALALIAADARLNALVQLTKTAAKNPVLKDASARIESLRPDLGGEIVFTVVKADSFNSPEYGVRVGYIAGGNAFASIPLFYARCSADGGSYDYNQYAPFEGGHLNNNDPRQFAPGDVLSSVHAFIPTTGQELNQQQLNAAILEELIRIAAKIPAQDGELSK